jgi:glycosyltransferase involved in cell wall biosynthesis
MQRPLISVCITTYNHARYIHQCVTSVLMQDWPNLEILIGDDLSDDGTDKIITDLASRYPTIRYFRYTEKKGPGRNIGFLVAEARGEYITHLDGDDFWLPGKLFAQMAFLESNPDCPAVYTNAFSIFDDGQGAGVFTRWKKSWVTSQDLICYGNFLNHSSMLYRAYLKNSLLENPHRLDYHIHLLWSKNGVLGYLPQALVVYRLASVSSFVLHHNDKVREMYWNALTADVYPGVSSRDLSQGIAEFLRMIFFRCLKVRSFTLWKKWWPRAAAQAPSGKILLLWQVFLAIVRVGFGFMLAFVYGKISGNHLRIDYPK